ncbi:mite group 2 allergen-like Ixo r 2 [Oppia nitens]|uniref:mite group 2 allergen-like Ixo r 2 n=1 Tax=Oppia nitens TaxID=1686743 RepID=UPI0023D98202|nr:mite group 2 allergen-like Ixo r 2 [Oppia nitens]
MIILKLLILLVAIISQIYCLQLTDKSYKPCDNANNVKSIEVIPCSSEPCAFKRSTQVSVRADFTTQTNADFCRLEMKAQLGDWYPISEEAACPGFLNCPLKTNEDNTLNYKTTVDSALPAGERLTRWKLICDSGATQVFCADINIVIQ